MRKGLNYAMMLLFFCLGANNISAQVESLEGNFMKSKLSEEQTLVLTTAIDSLLSQLEREEITDQYLSPSTAELLKPIYEWFISYAVQKDIKDGLTLYKQLINVYELEENKFSTSIAYIGSNEGTPSIRSIMKLVAKIDKGKVMFSLPYLEETSHWHKYNTETVSYYYKDNLRTDRADAFDKSNQWMAQQFGIKPDKLEFFMCQDYQEILGLLGIEYIHYEAGKIRDGYGVIEGKIFSIQNNENFSHDIFHHYSSKVNERQNRNWIAEEGIAYYWGNAYYTDENGEMIEQETLVQELDIYLKQNAQVSIFKLYKDDEKIFNHLASEASVQKVISGILVKEVETKFGFEGIQKLINCGSKDRMEKFMVTIEELLDIHEGNFDERLADYILNY